MDSLLERGEEAASSPASRSPKARRSEEFPGADCYIGVVLGLFWDDGKENGNYF